MTTGYDDAVAIVGMAGSFPGAADVDGLWENVLRESSHVTLRTGPAGDVLWARGELGDVAMFDPAFFGMSPRDALTIDPQHRILLECAWEALADAGCSTPDAIRRTAVYAGANYSGYRDLLGQAGTSVSALEFDSGLDKDFLATTIAYRLGLQGPCMTVQTACSSSLVAVHLACQSLLEYESDQALAGGVSLVLPHSSGWRFEPAGIHSPDGVCRPFDAEANGTVMGDGAGMVTLRRLEDAITDNCRIYAVIRGTAVNNDGSRKIGYAAPSVGGQAEVIRTALERAGVSPDEVGYVEAHGTGTRLGDQVEFRALAEVFATGGAGQCAVGSFKGAIGHLDVAAGVTGLIRTALAVHHAVIPGTVNHRSPHPGLAIDDTPFFIPPSPLPWKQNGQRIAGVSNFGVGGTNVHVILADITLGTGGVPAAKRRTLTGEGYAPRRYWPEPATSASTLRGPSLGVEADSVQYLRTSWREWAPGSPPPERPGYARVLLLADADPTSDRIHRRLADAGGLPVDRIQAAGHELALDPQAAVRDILRRAAQGGQTLVVCTWALADGEAGRRSYDALAALASGWLSGHQKGDGLDVVMVTCGAWTVTGDEDGDPALCAITGLARTLSMEALAIRVRVVDLADTREPGLADAASHMLAWQDEPVLARRGRRWWQPAYESTSFPSIGAPPAPGASVVLGAGLVGAAAAGVLFRTGEIVALTGRTSVGASRVADAIRDESPGRGTVLADACDFSDPQQVDLLLTRLVSRLGPIRQVVLAAGISGDAAYQASSHLPRWEDEDHFRVKVDGVAALAATAARHNICRIVLMSSLSGVLGAISLGPYSAAAAAMDGRATRLDGQAGRWLSIGWDAWQHDDLTASAHELRMVQDGLTPYETEEALSRLLLSDATGHILVVKGDFAARWDRFIRQPLHRLAVTRPARTVISDDIAHEVLDSWRTALADTALGLDDDLLERGADSLSSIEVLAALDERFGVSLPNDLIFETPTPRALADRIRMLLSSPRDGERILEVRQWEKSAGPAIWCMHPISGSTDCFGTLADLLSEGRIAAVTGQPISEVRQEESIEEQAGRHCRLLTGVTSAPAVIVGWSYGGILAFEAAQQVLRATGRAPGVVLIDIPAPTAQGGRSIADVGDAEIILAIVSHRLREAGRLLPPDVTRLRSGGLALVLEFLRAHEAVPATFTRDAAIRLITGYRHRMRAAERYRPVVYPGHLALLRASEPEFGDTGILDGVMPTITDDPSWGWAALTRGACATWEVSGHHATLLQSPSVHAVARAVQQSIREA
jgi:3-oxoacyl-(acyl-carrier-protein) synthase/thioesterase domain-containing protein/acyl carrier protein